MLEAVEVNSYLAECCWKFETAPRNTWRFLLLFLVLVGSLSTPSLAEANPFPCVMDLDCPPCYTCEVETGQCQAPPPEIQCESNADCGDGVCDPCGQCEAASWDSCAQDSGCSTQSGDGNPFALIMLLVFGALTAFRPLERWRRFASTKRCQRNPPVWPSNRANHPATLVHSME